MSLDLVVVGLGYVGLPLAARAREAGLATTGLDTCEQVVRGLRAGRSHVGDVPDDVVAGMVASGFEPTADPAVLAEADTVVLCVPTGLSDSGEPDLTAVRAAARTVGEHLRPGTLVVLESTSFPGTTEEVVLPLLESGSGLVVGDDFHLVYSPERIDPGNASFGVHNTPKVVGGVTPLCAKYGVAFYSGVVDAPLVVSKGTREAEMSKLLENTHRYLNIALVNEVATYCDSADIDVWDVLHCAATKPFGYSPFHPGPGVGGHCIPVDPRYLGSKARAEGFTFSTLEAAHAVNERMPEHVCSRVGRILRNEGKSERRANVVLLGVAYKRDLPDTRQSPAYPVARGLMSRGARVRYHDPNVQEFTVDGEPVPAADDLRAALAAADVAVLLQDHSCYSAADLTTSGCPVLDTRGRYAGENVTLL